MPSPFPCSPVICECSGKKIQIEKKKLNFQDFEVRQKMLKRKNSGHVFVREILCHGLLLVN